MIAQRVEFGSNRFGLWQLGVNIAFLDDELTAHFCCGQPGIKPVVAKLRVGLALPIHDFFDVCKQMGQAVFGKSASAQGKGVLAGNPGCQFVISFADGFSVPSQFALGHSLSACTEFNNDAGHEHTPRAAFERFGGLNKQRFETLGEFHDDAPACDSRLFHIHWNDLIIESPLALHYTIQGQYAKAESVFERSLSIRVTQLGPEHPDVADSLNNLSGLAIAARKPEKALELMRRANRIEDALLGQMFAALSENQRMAYLAERWSRFEIFLSILVECFPDRSDAVGDALDLTLRRKSLAAEAAALQHEAVLNGRYPHLKPELQTLTELRWQIAQWTLAGPGALSLAAHRQQLEEANREKERLQAQLARQIPEMNLQAKMQAASRADVALSLPQNAALVEFVRYDRIDFHAVPANGEPRWLPARYLAFVLAAGKPDDVRMIDLSEAEPIDRLVASFRAAILEAVPSEDARRAPAEADTLQATSGAARTEIGQALRRALLEPLTAALGDCHHLLLVPDGDLTRLPFEALPAAEAERCLCDEYRLSYLSVGRDALRFGIESTADAQPARCLR